MIKAMKNIEKKYQIFRLRKEIIYEILKSMKLDISDLDSNLDTILSESKMMRSFLFFDSPPPLDFYYVF